MRKLFPAIMVVLIELYTGFVTFVITPYLAGFMPKWSWIAVEAVFLTAVNLAGCYILRREHPAIWFWGVPVEVAMVTVCANINSEYLINGLGLYGIYSKYATETDAVLTFFPYYIDAVVFATLIIAGRLIFYIPIHYVYQQIEKVTLSSSKPNIAKQ